MPIETLHSLFRATGHTFMEDARFEARNQLGGIPAFGAGPLLELGGGRSYSGQIVTEQTALSIAAVLRAVSLISGSAAMMPLNVMRESQQEKQVDKSHSLYPLLTENFSPTWTAYRAKRFIVEQILLRGNSICKYSVSGNGRVTSIDPVHVDRVLMNPQTDGSLRYFITERDGSMREYGPSSILHIRNIEANDMGIGLSTLQAGKNTMGLAMSATEASSKFFHNGFVANGFLQREGAILNADAQKKFEESIEKYKGLKNAFGLPIIPGSWKYTRTGLTPSDVQFLETAKLTTRDIANLFNLPARMLNEGAAAVTSAEQEAIEFLIYCLQPLLTNIECECHNTLLSATERQVLSIAFDPDVLLRTDAVSRYSKYQKGTQAGVLKPSEARRMENLPHDPDGDTLVVNAATVKLRDAGLQWTGKESPAPVHIHQNEGKE